MNEEELQPKSNQWAPDDEEAKNFVNQPGYQKGAIGMVNLIVDVMNDTHEYKEAIFGSPEKVCGLSIQSC